MKTRSILLAPLLLAASLGVRSETPAAVAAPVPASAPAPTNDTTISIRDFSFAPTSTTVTVGTTVRWTNFDGEPHTVHGVDASFRSNALDQNESFAFKFDKPGTYRYVCSIHPQMVGTIVVKDAR